MVPDHFNAYIESLKDLAHLHNVILAFDGFIGSGIRGRPMAERVMQTSFAAIASCPVQLHDLVIRNLPMINLADVSLQTSIKKLLPQLRAFRLKFFTDVDPDGEESSYWVCVPYK